MTLISLTLLHIALIFLVLTVTRAQVIRNRDGRSQSRHDVTDTSDVAHDDVDNVNVNVTRTDSMVNDLVKLISKQDHQRTKSDNAPKEATTTTCPTCRGGQAACIQRGICCNKSSCTMDKSECTTVPQHCRVRAKPCGKNGVCAANGICCYKAGCVFDQECSTLTDLLRRLVRMCANNGC